jgi:CheY-like chemotaxis protein
MPTVTVSGPSIPSALIAARRDLSHDYLLVVDDEPAIRTLVALMLARSGIPVRGVANGQEALAAIDTAPPALILLDLRMPVMDGLNFLTAYDQLPVPRPPVVIFSAHVDSLAPHVCAQVAAVLVKPVVKDKLLDVIGQHWQPSRASESASR